MVEQPEDAISLDDAMRTALEEARRAGEDGDVPIGAVVLHGGRIVGRGRNERERRGDPTAHAEMLALQEAAATVGTGWRLDEATLVVTLEPCPMCAGAALAGRIGTIAYGAADPKAGACGSLYNLCTDPRLNHEMHVVHGVLATECGEVLRSFFAARRG